MTTDQVKSLVEGCIAANPVPHIPVSVKSVTANGGIFAVILSTTVQTLGNFDDTAYYTSIEDCVAENANVTLMLSGLQPETQKSVFNRDPDK
jgi:hypothetical protein